jgi:ribonucleoside-triphosphate reductase
MNVSQKILSDVTVHMKYAKYLPGKERRETWEEVVGRNRQMHLDRFPDLHDEIINAYQFVLDRKILPSMRSMQFAGRPIELNPSRIFNCSYLPIDDWRAFPEIMFLLLGGTGVGYSVQRQHVDQLPVINKPRADRRRRWLVGDSIEGWSDSVRILMKSYFLGGPRIEFDFRDVRQKGSRLVTSGGKAPGPQPLKECLTKVQGILDAKEDGDRLTPLEVHDIICHLADAVLAGGIRRAALISLFSADDMDMITAKSGSWWELNPQRGRANNSAVLDRNTVTQEQFVALWERIKQSGAGEPGIYWTDDLDWGTNPCCEIALRPFQFCNLVTVNVSDVLDQDDLNARVRAAALLGTLQAAYTDFHYLRPIWKRTTEKEALLGVSMTGIASGAVLGLDMTMAADMAVLENRRIAEKIGINPAARTTCIKPEGTSSLVLGCSSGVHAWFAPFYKRRLRVGKNEAIYTYLMIHHPEVLEDCFFRPHDTAIITIPQKAPEGSILRTETALDLLERVKRLHSEWIKPGHVDGVNTHNVSATISIDGERTHVWRTEVPVRAAGYLDQEVDEWTAVGYWMWYNREHYNGLSVLPYNGGSYIQAPFEECTEYEYNRLLEALHDIDLSKVIEITDETNLAGEAACAGGACEIV